MEQSIEYLNSWGDWRGSELWLGSAANELNRQYRELRQDVRTNTNSWCYSKFCERLAYHYFNLACYFNDELFNKHKIGLKSIKLLLEKCLQMLNEMLNSEKYSNETLKLKNDAKKFLKEITNIYEQQKIIQIQCSPSNVRKYIKLCIVVENIDQIPSHQCPNEEKRLIQNILLIRLIYTLENNITVRKHKNTFLIAQQSNYLSQAYQLAEQFKLSQRYKNTSENLIKTINTYKRPELNVDKRTELEDIIGNEVGAYKSNLEQVKNYIEEKFHQSLSSIDTAFIETEYVKCCARFWLQETADSLMELIAKKNRIVIQDIFYSLDVVKGLSQVPNPLNQLKFYSLLMEHFEIITEENQRTLVGDFKKECFDKILTYSDSAKNELELFESFINFLSSSRDLQSIIFELGLVDFCQDMLTFDNLINNIMRLDVAIYGESLKALQQSTKSLRKEEDLFLIDKLKEIVGAYTKPVKIQKCNLDGRLVVEVVAKNIVISNILKQLEYELSGKSRIEEVRFVGDDVVHVDADFKVDTWHGINIVVLTKVVKVYNKVVWDVSGESNNHSYLENAGTDTNGHGKQGKDGYSGESGGNVVILTTNIENSENFTIISNGGSGSKGQDGGNGKDGKDGVGIRKIDFDNKFPSPVRFMNSPGQRWESASKLFESIKQKSSIIDCQIKEKNTPTNIFIEATTSDSKNVIYSYCGGSFTTRYQSFLLIKGSLGQPGGRGGEFGLGGQGGHSGDVDVRNVENENLQFHVIKIANHAKAGKNGRGGLCGRHGKNGWDMGFLDYQTWKDCKYRGRDENSKCTLEYYNKDNTPSDRVWCEYKNMYAAIKCTNIEHKKEKMHKERMKTRHNNDRQHHAQAVRKKNISQNSILTKYSHHLSSVEWQTLKNVKSELENINQRAIQAITENQEQQANQNTEISITRHTPYQIMEKYNSDLTISTTSKTQKTDEVDATTLIENLTKEPNCADYWFQLSQTELNLTQLKRILLIFTENTNESKLLKDVERILLDKYRFAVLQEIARILPTQQEAVNCVNVSSEDAGKYLIESKANENNISHPVLGTLNQYLFEINDQLLDRVFNFCEEELQKENEKCESLNRSIIQFVFEVGELEEVYFSVKKYYTEYRQFMENHIESLKIFLEVFKSEISQPEYEKILSLWLESIQTERKKRELEADINKYPFLQALYNRLNTELMQKYEWNNCCKDVNVLKEHRNYIRKNGLLSGTYRELLANIFSINIRLYVEDQNQILHLQSDHNPSSKRTFYILLRGNKLFPLDIDKSYLTLKEGRKNQNILYAKILTEIKLLKRKEEFDEYLENNTFLSENKLPENTHSFDERRDIENIIKHFPEEERQQLIVRLDKISSQYIGQQIILNEMSNRFSREGRYVSSQELYFLISSILNSDKKEQNIFAWVVAAYSQKKWIDELILLQIENYFRQALEEKQIWRKYLSQIENKEILLLFEMKLDQQNLGSRISIQCVEDIFHLFSHISHETMSLEGLDLAEWPYALKEKYWKCKLLKIVSWELDDLETSSYYVMSIENIFGRLLTESFINVLARKTKEKEKLSSQKLTNILSNFHHEKWCLNEDTITDLNNCTIDAWEKNLEDKFIANKEERNITQLVELIKHKANTSKQIIENLPKIKSYIEVISIYKINKKRTSTYTENDIKNWVRTISKSRHNIEEKYEEIFAVIDRAIELKRGFKLRDTQRITVLTLLTNRRNTLAQVSTGEGKSLIVVAASIMKAICGMKVDIITSSSVLARRDADDNRDIYNLFDINVSHNCNEDIAKRKEAYSSNHVIYGDLSNFQRDYLLDKFYGKNILGDRDFENVIVDEVDSMLLDKGNNMLYLSHDLPGMDKLESVYIFIWQWINRPAANSDEVRRAFDVEAIKEAVISDLYGLVKKEDIATVGSELSKLQINVIWERLIETKIVDDSGKLLVDSASDSDLNKIFSGELAAYKDRFRFLLKELFDKLKCIHVPNALRSFIDQHLDSWINSAVAAYFMKEGENYVVDVDKTGTNPDRNPKIIILDTDTGTDQLNSQWDEGLHQFLQLKHGCKLSLQSLKAVFISNVSFFKLYKYLYGLTGTLGSEIERDLLQEIHGVDFVTIPTAKSKQFCEYKPILCSGKTDWVSCICSEVIKLIEVEKRSVLVICETVNEVKVLHKAFGGNNAKHVHTYTRDYEEFERGFQITNQNKELGQGQIIIATNLAGRGTDIKITQELREAKGLHVCLTYLPNNVRVENQAFGRAARCGDQGSGQLIVFNSQGQGYSNSKVVSLKKQRDSEERHRVSRIKEHYFIQITTEENLFKLFKEQYKKLKLELNKKMVSSEVSEILLQSCLDKWAFWLDEHSRYVRDLKDEQGKISLYSQLDKLITQLKTLDTGYTSNVDAVDVIEYDTTSWLAWVEGNSSHMIKLGKYLCENKSHKNAQENALKLFDDVIKIEPHFSEAAHYYKAYALAKKINWEKITEDKNKENLQKFKNELQNAEKLLKEHSSFAIQAAGIIGKIKKNNNVSIIQIDAYEEQQKSLANLYYMFSQSIADILGHGITPHTFVNTYIGKELAEDLYTDLLSQGVLIKPKVKYDISEKELQLISFGYGISFEALKKFLSKYQGNNINEKQFQEELKKQVQMPSREVFWKCLIQQKFLNDEIKYVVVDYEKFLEIDPSLCNFLSEKEARKEIEKQTFDQQNEWIYYNAECVERQKNNSNIFKKDDFIDIVGKDMYKVLKQRGVLSFNRKAHVDMGKYESMVFPCYDSITVEDFAKVNIIKSDAEQILLQFVEQDVLEKLTGLTHTTYRLKVRYEEINELQLSFCPVYESAVKRLVYSCFSYRIAFQKIQKHIEAKEFFESLHLMIKPHHNLIQDLFELRIIGPTMVVEDPEKKLNSMYCQTMTKDQFIRMLARDKRIPKTCTEDLFGYLIKKKWAEARSELVSETCTVDLFGYPIKKKMEEAIIELDDCYYITNPDKRQLPLNFYIDELRSIDKTVARILDNRLRLSDKNSIKTIVSSLKRSKSLLETLKVPEPNLQPLTKLLGEGNFSSIEEVHIFFLNGLNQLIQFEEKKWTKEMLVNTAIVVAMGVVQITAGGLIELYSSGAMTHVGAAFINEGLSDIMYAMGALMSGHFSWGDYWEHKLVSLAMTTVTVGVGAYFSRGAKVSRFGHKIAGPNLEIGTKVAEMTGNKLISEVGLKTVGKELAKRIIIKTVEGVAIGLSNAAVDTVVQNCLRTLCEGLSTKILQDIDTSIETHDISISIKNVYQTLDTDNAKQLINDVTKSVLSRQTYMEQIAGIASKLGGAINKGIEEAFAKTNKTNNKMAPLIGALSKAIIWSSHAAHIANIALITNEFLNKLDKEITDELKKVKNIKRDEMQEKKKDYESFKKEIIDEWKSLFHEKAGQIIAHHVVSPILKDGANRLVRYIGKNIQETYQSFKESENFEFFEELREDYKKNLQNARNSRSSSGTTKHIKEKYEKDLIKLMAKTRNPKLFAAIVRENVPMDMTCVNACTIVIHKMLQNHGIKRFSIVVEGEGGIRQKFSCGPDGEPGLTIKLQLKDNHFQLAGSSNSKISNNSNNNCLFEAISEGICLEMRPEQFRAEIANCIERDKKVQYDIRQGWHKFAISRGAMGGERANNQKISGDELNKRIKLGTIRFSQSSIATKTKDGINIEKLSQNIKDSGWEGDPIKAVLYKDKTLVVLDHRRTLSVAITQSPDVDAHLAVYTEEDEFSSETCEQQYGTPKAGEAVTNRQRRGSLPEYDGIGFISSDVRIRIPVGTELSEETLNALKDMKFQVEGRKRSKSLDKKSKDRN